MNAKELRKLLTGKGISPEKAIEIIERYTLQKERLKKYQRERYEKVTVSVKKDDVEKLVSHLGDRTLARKVLACLKLLSQKEVFEIIKQLTKDKLELPFELPIEFKVEKLLRALKEK